MTKWIHAFLESDYLSKLRFTAVNNDHFLYENSGKLDKGIFFLNRRKIYLQQTNDSFEYNDWFKDRK